MMAVIKELVMRAGLVYVDYKMNVHKVIFGGSLKTDRQQSIWGNTMPVPRN